MLTPEEQDEFQKRSKDLALAQENFSSRRGGRGGDSTQVSSSGGYITLGLEFFLTISLLTIGGYYADRYLGISSFLTLLGLSLGFGLGLYRLIQGAKQLEDKKVLLLAHAKLNLGLVIPFKYNDGYHHIVSLITKIDLCDKVEIEPSTKSGLSLFLKNDHTELKPEIVNSFLEPNSNIIVKANSEIRQGLKQLSDNAGLTLLNDTNSLKVSVKKEVPSPSGLGGGSSNGSVIFRYYLSLYKNDKAKLKTLFKSWALKVGADIPFFLENGLSLVSGIGEVVATKPKLKCCGILGIPTYGFSTGAMYQEIGRLKTLSSKDKSTVQDDKEAKDILNGYYFSFASLYDSLKTGFIERNSLFEENNSGYLLKNDFWLALKSIDKKAYQEIGQAMHDMCGAVEKVSQRKPFYALTGSGSSFFAILPEGVSSKLELGGAVQSLEREQQNFKWLSFKTE